MVELGFILYIVLLFVFPHLTIAIGLGLGTTYWLRQKYYLFQNQPKQGGKIVLITNLLFALNIALSLCLGFLIALSVYLVIHPSNTLFLFNFVFSATISMRWFDFTHKWYRALIKNITHRTADASADSVFAVCQGYRSVGYGRMPVFIDAGVLRITGSDIQFEGVFIRKPLNAATVLSVRKKSFEGFKVQLNHPGPDHGANTLLFTLKDNFYPFRCKESRNRIFDKIHFQASGI
jgi:hypothetical protein